MNPADILSYSPFPYWIGSVLAIYRHDLSRLFHPVRDNGSLRNWWYVLGYLGLLGHDAASRPSVNNDALPYVVYSVGAVIASLSWLFRLFPPSGYYLVLIQAVSGLLLTTATMRYLGPPPRRPYVDVLRYPRLGSRVRHLPKTSTFKGKNHESQRPISPSSEGTLTALDLNEEEPTR
jgi:hypothetical protein